MEALNSWDLSAAPCHPTDARESKALWKRMRARIYHEADGFKVKRGIAETLYSTNYKAKTKGQSLDGDGEGDGEGDGAAEGRCCW